MNLPTIIGAIIVFTIFTAIIVRGIHNKKNGKGGCACGGDCSSCGGGCYHE